MNSISGNWLFLALIGTIIGAVVHIVDTYLREDDVFEHPLEPTVISGAMQSMLWVIVPFVGFEVPDRPSLFFLAFFGGILHLLSLYFYFKAVFTFRDMSTISILWNLLLGMVPILASVFLDEVLAVEEYFGILLLFLGATAITYSRKIERREFSRVLSLMLAAVFLMALSMVCLKAVYGEASYWSGYFAYNLGIVGAAVILFAACRKRERHRLRTVTSKFFSIFLFMEFLQLIGEFLSNRAVSLGPVSLVASVESLQAVFIFLLSWVVFFFFRYFLRNKEYLAIAVRNRQMNALGVKLIAVLFMAWGVYLIE